MLDEAFKENEEAAKKIAADKKAYEHLTFLQNTCQATSDSKIDHIIPLKPAEEKKPSRESIEEDNMEDSGLQVDLVTQCREDNIEAFNDSDDPEKVKALKYLVTKVEDRIATLSSKGNLTPKEAEELQSLHQFHLDNIATNDTLRGIVQDWAYKLAQADNNNILVQIQAMQVALSQKNFAGAYDLLGKIRSTQQSLMYHSSIVGDYLSSTDKNYQTQASFLNTVFQNGDLGKTITDLASKLPKNNKSGTGGIYSQAAAQAAAATGDPASPSSVDNWAQNYKIANKIAERATTSMGALYPQIFEKEPTTAQCFIAGNCTGLDGIPSFRLLGSGSVAANSGTNFNSVTSAVLQNNSVLNPTNSGFSNNSFTNNPMANTSRGNGFAAGRATGT